MALKIYRLDHGEWPTSIATLAEHHEVFGKYLEATPVDPWRREYHFSGIRPAGVAVEEHVYVWSYGADGEPGGSGKDADVGNWMYATHQPWWRKLTSQPDYCLGNWSGELTTPRWTR